PDTFGLGPEHVVLGRSTQPDDVLGRLDEHTHLVVVVGAGYRDAVHPGTDDRAQDLPNQSDIPLAVLGMDRGCGHSQQDGTAIQSGPSVFIRGTGDAASATTCPVRR